MQPYKEFVKRAIDSGYSLCVVDDNWTDDLIINLSQCNRSINSAINSTARSIVNVCKSNGEEIGWAYIIPENGEDAIVNYSVSIESLIPNT